MKTYHINNPCSEDAKPASWFDLLYWYDHFVGPFNLIDHIIGEIQMLTDSRATCKGKRGAAWLVAFAKAVVQEQSGRVRFVLPRKGQYSQREITDLLEQYGIRTRRYKHDGANTYFVVRGSQAEWAIRVIEQIGSGTLGPSWKEQAGGAVKQPAPVQATAKPKGKSKPAAVKRNPTSLLTRIKNG
jgi:hypothetical protein